jgi:hypothetical protein
MRRIRALTFSVLLTALAMPGCQPKPPEEELGTIQYEVPKVPGADQPYELPPATDTETGDTKSAPPSDESSADSSGTPAAAAVAE